MFDVFLPRDRVYIPELSMNGIVTSVRMSSFGTEYLVRYASEGIFYEVLLYDFEVRKPIPVNA